MSITLRGIELENFANYKKPAMFLAFPYCDFKCGEELCQNSSLLKAPLLKYTIKSILNAYKTNNISQAIIMGGLEPFNSYNELQELITQLRSITNDDIVIYTGYTEDEIQEKINSLTQFPNIIIKFGRYIPNQEPHYDEVLGVNLASDNQYAKRVS